mmetsp:Transcript_4765/g.9777  ORF Transcript_4765/g.9777 Transcript_4765/m.9777 type:complete len:419 (+) Transcript_4765:55-1311(+)
MWSPNGPAPEMGSWSTGLEAMDYGSPGVAGSPMAGTPMAATPMSGMPSSYPSTPMSGLASSLGPNSMAFGNDLAAQACNLAPALEAQLQSIAARVQKLERSRGQISKDIADMLGDTKELQKTSGLAACSNVSDIASKKAERIAASLVRVAEGPVESEEVSADVPAGPAIAKRSSRHLKTAPACPLPRVDEEPDQSQPQVTKATSVSIPPPPGLGAGLGLATLRLQESLTVQTKAVGGKEVSRIEWRIDNVKAKLKDYCVGRPLVSPQFEASGLPELRLMVFPNLGLDTSSLTMREQKARYEARIVEGPLCGALKFKVVTSLGDKLVIDFNLFVGDVAKGPIQHNFADHIIQGADFANNWLDQVKSGSLVVGVEILNVQSNAIGSGCSETPAAGDPEVEGCDGLEWEQMSQEIRQAVRG